MATSGSRSVSVTSWNTLKFSWAQVSQSVANNNTKISWKLELIAGSSGRISSGASKDWSVTVNGTNYSGTNTVGIANNATKTLASGSTTIAHNADGSKSFSYSFSQEFGITFSGTSVGTKSGSGTGELNTIPRATQPTVSASSVDMGGKVTISTPRASSSFTHDLAYAFAGSGYVSITTGVGTSYSWTVPDLASQIPNATSGTVTIRCITKNGSTTVGTKTVLLTAKVPSSVVPTISSVAVVEATSGLASQFGALVQGKSKVKTTITAAGAKGSTISAYSATYQGKTYTASTWTSDIIRAAGSQSMTVKVKDSRGRWSTVTTKTFNVQAYEAPTITKLRAYRVNASGVADDQGQYAAVEYAYAVAAVGGKNTASMKIEFKRSTAAEYATGDVLTTSTALQSTGKTISTGSFSADYQYDLKLTVEDWFGASSTFTTVLPSGAVVLDLKADGLGIAFGKTADKEGADFGWSPKGAVLGLWEATASIPEGADFNDYLQPGVYAAERNDTMTTLVNRPCDRGGTLRVSSGIGTKKVAGAYAYIVQEFHSYHNMEPIYRRHLISDASGAFEPGPWRAITFRGQKVLWSGNMYMTAGHRADLDEEISKQDNGIVLVFSTYQNGAAVDANFNCFFVPKHFVSIMGGYGMAFQMNTVNFSTVATKYLYVHDTHIQGNENNNLAGTATSGVTFNNASYVLRYVLGV